MPVPDDRRWWSVAPFHGVEFGSMTHNIATSAGRVRQQREQAA
jgi:hypothetical protein